MNEHAEPGQLSNVSEADESYTGSFADVHVALTRGLRDRGLLASQESRALWFAQSNCADRRRKLRRKA